MLSDSQHQLALVAARVQEIEDIGEGIEATIAHVLADLQAAGRMPLAEFADRLGNAVDPIEDNEALQLEALRENISYILQPLRWRRGVVGGDQAAKRNASEQVHLREHGIEDLPADVLEVDVDALGAGGLEIGGEIAAPVVDTGIEAQVFRDVPAFVRPAGNADGAAALDLRNLADDRADGARRGRDNDGFAGLRLPYFEQAEIRGPNGHAYSADPAFERCQAGIDPDHAPP